MNRPHAVDQAGSFSPDGPATLKEQQSYESYVKFCRMVGNPVPTFAEWREISVKVFGGYIPVTKLDE